jgi:hypothetical protein
MTWASISSTALPLVGVALGAGGTLLGQYLALRAGVRRDATQRASEQRGERKQAIIDFLSAAEPIEQLRGKLQEGNRGKSAVITEQMHAVWLAKKVIELVCSANLAQAAQDYTEELNAGSKEFARTGRAGGLSRLERQRRATFMEMARRELGYKGEPLRRLPDADRPGADTDLAVPQPHSPGAAS